MTAHVVTAAQAASRDRAAIESGVPSRALMQRAGAAAAAEIAHRYPSSPVRETTAATRGSSPTPSHPLVFQSA
jgi:NAD(P)H-hydrate repair Nnr-like enzyme with NAD(P)H-hydrate epimerase domain